MCLCLFAALLLPVSVANLANAVRSQRFKHPSFKRPQFALLLFFLFFLVPENSIMS